MNNSHIEELAKLFNKNSREIFLVGGAVRDEILKIENADIDLCGDALYDEVCQICGKDFSVLIQSKKLGTLKIFREGFSSEYTPFRSEVYENAFSHSPSDVNFEKSKEVDATRRDFTINCIYKNALTGQLFDPYNGVRDLKNKKIRAIREKVFDVDPLRIFRMVRLSASLGFKIEKKTFALAKEKAKNTRKLSGERLREELQKIIESKNSVRGIINFMKLKIFPKSKLKTFKTCPSLLCLCFDLFGFNERKNKKFLEIYAKNNKEKFKILDTLKFVKKFEKYQNVKTMIGAEHLLKDASLIIKNQKAFLRELDKVIEKKLPLSISQLDINGRDLIMLGKNEKEFSTILKSLLEKVVCGDLENKKEVLIKEVKGENK